MIDISMYLMIAGVSGIVVFVLLYTIITLYQEWKTGFKTDVLIAVAFLMPIILIAVGAIIYAIYK